jgi:long-chain acyl-CoA synthetase
LGAYQWLTYGEVLQRVDWFGSALAHIGLKKNDRLGLFEETRLEWTVAAHGAWRQGLTILTVYANLGEEALVYALGLGEVTTMVLNGKSLPIIVSAKAKLDQLKHLIYTDKADPKQIEAAKAAGMTVISYDEALSLGKTHFVEGTTSVGKDLAMIMFTSGTTGLPKGVMLTHEQSVAAIAGAVAVLVTSIGITPEKDVYISFLPLAHILALIVHCALFYVGVPIGYGSPRSLTDASVRNCKGDLRELEPTLFVGVPTVYERIKAGIERKLRASPVSHTVFNMAFALKRRLAAWGIPTKILDAIVFNKIKREVGGRVRAMVSGGAALSAPVIEFVETSFGCRLLQGYGLTETAGPSAVQELTDFRRGSVGSPLPSTRIKLVDAPEMNYLHTNNPPQGEIWIGGANISSGYYKNPEETAKAFVDGWFRTGDVGEWTPEGTLKIVDRIKNLIKPPHGEYVALESIESRYRDCPFVDHICAYVDSEHNEVVAIVAPNKLATEAWASKNGIDSSDWGVLCQNPELTKAVLKDLQATARKFKLKSHEMVRALHITAEEWTPDNDMLTAAQKLKRNNIISHYRKQLNDMYATFQDD